MSARTATAEVAFGLPATGPEESSLRLEFAQEVDRLGYESMWFAHSITRDVPGLDTLEMLAAVAAITKRVKLGTNVLQLPLYHPVALARMLLTIDHISQGRLILGAGVGWIPKEFGNLGVPFKERGGRTAEALEILKRLWTEEEVTFEGRYYQIREVRLEPKPVQKPHPKILVGGGFKGDQRGAPGAFDGIGWNQTVIRRVARFGDGWLPGGDPPAWVLGEGMERIRAAGREMGRNISDEDFEICVSGGMINMNRNRTKAIEEAKEFYDSRIARGFYQIQGNPAFEAWLKKGAIGSPEDIAQVIRGKLALKASVPALKRFTYRFASLNPLDQLERFNAEVRPLLGT